MKNPAWLILLLVIPSQAYAYIDPASASAIMSAVIGFFVASGLAIKSQWYKLKSFFTGKAEENDSEYENEKDI